MNTKTLDKKLAATVRAIRKPPASEAKRVLQLEERRIMRERIREIGLDSPTASLLADVLNGSDKATTKNSIPAIRALRERGLTTTASALFEGWKDLYRELPFQEIKSEAPDAKALEAWRKAAAMRGEEMEEKLLSDPLSTYETSGADWILSYGKPERSLPVLRLFLRRQARPKHLLQWADAIAERLRHDKRGVLLKLVLSTDSESTTDITTLADVIRNDRQLFLLVIGMIPRIVSQKDAAPHLMNFIRELFANVVLSEGSDREFLTAALARLGSGLLLERSGNQTKVCLEFLQGSARQLRNVTREEELRRRTWVFENLFGEDMQRDAGLHVTIDGARQLAIALEKAQQGFDAREILAVTARNLGLVPIGTKEESVSFSPIKHRDIEGGLLPGDPARIIESGWSYQDDVIVRAKVKKMET